MLPKKRRWTNPKIVLLHKALARELIVSALEGLEEVGKFDRQCGQLRSILAELDGGREPSDIKERLSEIADGLKAR